MYNNFYVKLNYKNIIPFNLKKKKIRIHSNLIANRATAAQGYFFGVKMKFWYFYFSINGLKKDNEILVKNFSNKRLSVFFISNFNMIEGKWIFSKIYNEYYQSFSFLKKKKLNLIKFNFLKRKNFDIFTINKYKNNCWLQIYYYNLSNNKCNHKNNNYYYQYKFIKSKIPLIYNYNKNIIPIKQNAKNNYINNKFVIIKNLLNITQFVKLYKSLKKNKYKNINLLLYNLYVYFKYIKLSKFNYKILSNKLNLVNLIYNIYNQTIYRKKFKTYIDILKYKFQDLYKFKISNNIWMKKKNIILWKLEKKKKLYIKKYWLYFNNANLLNKKNIFLYIRNKKKKKNQNFYSFIKKKNQNKFQYIEKCDLYNQKLKLNLLKLLNSQKNY